MSNEDRIELTAEELERLSSDSEGGPAKRLDGWLGWLTSIVAFGVSAYALYWTQFTVHTTIYRSSFLAIVLALIFILYPHNRDGKPSETELTDWIFSAIAVASAFWLATTTDLLSTAPILVVILGVFALFPLAKRNAFLARTNLFDWILAALALYTAIYLAMNTEAIKTRATRPHPEELALGAILIVLVMEGTRRTVGIILSVVAAVFLVYCYFGPYMPAPFDHRGFSVGRIIGQNYLTLEGIFATPMDVAATFIILFTIYGAVLERGGAGKFFIDWAFALFGKKPSPSAPGRAVVASGFLLGTVSGSGVATTVTISSIAWPMLRRSGYDPNIAGGMLSAAGIGATLSPPTLGAAAFIIAEYLDVEYLEVLLYATIPTILYYVSCWIMTEADSRKLNVKPVKTSDASLWELTITQGYHFLSLGAIAIFLSLGFTSFMSVFWSIAIAFTLSMLRTDSRLVTPKAFAFGLLVGLAVLFIFDERVSVAAFWMMAAAMAFSGGEWLLARQANRPVTEDMTRMIEALTDGARSTLGIVATCACAGIIVSVVNITGLGLTISGMIVHFGGGERLITILLAALAMWVLGLAVPVTASYIIAAVMLVPALTQVGIPEPAAHMFMFYYAVLADVSPPTALAPFAASAICGGRPFATMMQAWKYTLPAFLVPVMFCMTPEGMRLLMFTPEGKWPQTIMDWAGIGYTTFNAILAVIGLAVALTGYAFTHLTLVERIFFGLGGALLLSSNPMFDTAGLIILAGILAVHYFKATKLAPA